MDSPIKSANDDWGGTTSPSGLERVVSTENEERGDREPPRSSLAPE